MNQRDASNSSRFQDLLDESIWHCFQEHCQKPFTDQWLRHIHRKFQAPLAFTEEHLFVTKTHNDAFHSNMIRAAQMHKNVENTRVLFDVIVVIKQVHRAVCFHAQLHSALSCICQNKKINC